MLLNNKDGPDGPDGSYAPDCPDVCHTSLQKLGGLVLLAVLVFWHFDLRMWAMIWTRLQDCELKVTFFQLVPSGVTTANQQSPSPSFLCTPFSHTNYFPVLSTYVHISSLWSSSRPPAYISIFNILLQTVPPL